MNKIKLLSVFLLSLSSLAAADVTLYGRVSVAAEADNFPSNTVVQPRTLSVQDYGSYFGIRGTDNVYGQTAAIWQVEQFLDIASGQAYQNNTGSSWVATHPGVSGFNGQGTSSRNTLASSDSYLGLQGTWGRIRIGNISNTFRTNTGAVDIYNGNNANAFGTYDRMLRVLPETVRYDSPAWGNLSFSATLSFNQDGNLNTAGYNGNGFYGAGNMNGYNNSPIYNFGLFYVPGNFSVTWNSQIWTNVGSYQEIGGNVNGYVGGQQITNPYNAYVSRLEIGYNDPDSFFIGGGFQITNGLGWRAVPGFGNQNNYWFQGANANGVSNQYLGSCGNGGQGGVGGNTWCPLNVSQITTQEMGISFGWHLDNWTPKIGYMFGNNLMAGGSAWDVISGNNQIGGTGYQQLVAELDWNITPRTIAFVNVGQIVYGNANQNSIMMANASNGGANTASGADAYLQSNGPRYINNNTIAAGFSHTF